MPSLPGIASHLTACSSLQAWTADAHITLMDAANISKSIISISSPGTSLWDDAAKCADLTRKVNSFAAGVQAANPERFGYWASLPLPYVNESIAEITTALDEGAAGFALMTNYHGFYLGDPVFDAVLQALDEKQAKIFVHPTTPCTACKTGKCDDALGTDAAPLAGAFPNPMVEFLFDTARVMTNMLLRAVYARFPHITTIYSHVGGAFPPLLSRIVAFPQALAGFLSKDIVAINETGVRAILNTRCYFDLAGSPFPGQLPGFLAATGVTRERLLYGSDYPFTPNVSVVLLAGVIDRGLNATFDKSTVPLVNTDNAKTLLHQKPCSP